MITFIILFLSVLLLISIYLNINLFTGRKQQDDMLILRVNETLSILDNQYSTIARVTAGSVMSDTPEVRTVAAALVNARESILEVAQLVEDIIIDDNSLEVMLEPVSYVGADMDDATVIQGNVRRQSAVAVALQRNRIAK